MLRGRLHRWRNGALPLTRSPALPSGQLSAIGRLPQILNRKVNDYRSPHPFKSVEDEPMPPDYELQSYWRTRFVGEEHFEWLGDGKDTILPHVHSFLLDSRSSSSPLARVLHIGAGTSSLSERLRELYISVYADDVDEGMIVNVDFVEELVTRKQAAEEARRAAGGPGKGMRWVRMDALEWRELKSLVDTNSGLFDLVVEKSTSDAISCGEDISYGYPGPSLHPDLNHTLKTHEGRTFTLSPVELLAIHLASVVRPGGLWVALTFSSNRFAFLSSPETVEGAPPRAADYWSLEQVITVDAPTGAQSNIHAPVVQHYVCLLRRKALP